MADIMNDNLSGDMANMNSAFEEMQLQVFEQMEEPLRGGAQYITDTIIPILTDWVPDAFGALAESAAKLGNALKPLFETILKNPQAIAGVFSSLGAGFVASGTMSIGKKISDGIAEAGSLGGALSKLATSVFENPWAAAVTAIGFAIHSYNQMQINDSLATHFGDIELDDSQIQDFAGHILQADSISKWAAEDMAELEKTKKQLTNLVEMVLEDGIIDVNEQEAINILQGKFNSILSGWKSSEAQAQMDLITQKYGRLSGKDLTSGTFTSIIEELQEQRETATEALEADELDVFGAFDAAKKSGRLTDSEWEGYKTDIAHADRNERAGLLAESLEYENNTISDTYGKKLNTNRKNIKDATEEYFEYIKEDFNTYGKGLDFKDIDYTSIIDSMHSGVNDAILSIDNDEDQGALKELYELNKPDVEAMEASIDDT